MLGKLLAGAWGQGRQLGCFLRMHAGVRRIVVWGFKTRTSLEFVNVEEMKVTLSCARIPDTLSDIGSARRHDVALRVRQRQRAYLTNSKERSLVILSRLSLFVGSLTLCLIPIHRTLCVNTAGRI